MSHVMLYGLLTDRDEERQLVRPFLTRCAGGRLFEGQCECFSLSVIDLIEEEKEIKIEIVNRNMDERMDG